MWNLQDEMQCQQLISQSQNPVKERDASLVQQDKDIVFTDKDENHTTESVCVCETRRFSKFPYFSGTSACIVALE